ncbi:asparagine synthase-related protein [Streptomyces albidoflavus]
MWDRLGEKPLYWRLDGGRLAFASEVTTLTGYGTAPLVVRPEMRSIETPAGVDTPFQGIQRLAPATLLAFDVATGSLTQQTWWTLEGLEPWQGDYKTAIARFSTLLAARVPLRAPGTDFALLLSGGLDSAMLAYLMRPQVCVTVRYPGQDRLDESATAAVVARNIGGEVLGGRRADRPGLRRRAAGDHARAGLPDGQRVHVLRAHGLPGHRRAGHPGRGRRAGAG